MQIKYLRVLRNNEDRMLGGREGLEMWNAEACQHSDLGQTRRTYDCPSGPHVVVHATDSDISFPGDGRIYRVA